MDFERFDSFPPDKRQFAELRNEFAGKLSDEKVIMPKPKRRRKIIIFTVIVLVLLCLVPVLFKKKQPPIPVTTEKVARRNLTETVVANGKIYPVVQLHISAEVSGEIIELAVKEGQLVKKGDLLLKIKPDFYAAAVNQSKAAYESSLNGQTTAEATLERADADYRRNKELYDRKLISDSDYVGFKTAFDIAVAQVESSKHQVEMAKAAVASAQDSLDKTIIFAPRDGTVSKLNSQLGERVLGTVQNAGTDIMIISDLNEMEARVDIGEMDVVLIQPGQKAELDVDAFKDRKFTGTVTQIANSSKGMGSLTAASTTQNQDATKFEVRIRFNDREEFRPGMSVSANIETRYRTNALSVPLAAVTTRPPMPGMTNAVAAVTDTNTYSSASAKADKKAKEVPKSVEVVFVTDGNHAKMMPVKIGICDDNYWEVTDGLTDGQEIIAGGPKAVNKDLQDGSEIKKNGATVPDVTANK